MNFTEDATNNRTGMTHHPELPIKQNDDIVEAVMKLLQMVPKDRNFEVVLNVKIDHPTNFESSNTTSSISKATVLSAAGTVHRQKPNSSSSTSLTSRSSQECNKTSTSTCERVVKKERSMMTLLEANQLLGIEQIPYIAKIGATKHGESTRSEPTVYENLSFLQKAMNDNKPTGNNVSDSSSRRFGSSKSSGSSGSNNYIQFKDFSGTTISDRLGSKSSGRNTSDLSETVFEKQLSCDRTPVTTALQNHSSCDLKKDRMTFADFMKQVRSKTETDDGSTFKHLKSDESNSSTAVTSDFSTTSSSSKITTSRSGSSKRSVPLSGTSTTSTTFLNSTASSFYACESGSLLPFYQDGWTLVKSKPSKSSSDLQINLSDLF